MVDQDKSKPGNAAQGKQQSPGQSRPGGMQSGKRRRQQSRYGIQIQEKKALKELYGIREEQLRVYYQKALRSKEETAPVLVSLLERRLDNAVFRAGFAQTRPQARQLVTHGYFMINGRRVDIPSYLLRKSDVVSVKESKRQKPFFSSFDKRMQNVRTPSWIVIDVGGFGFRLEGEIDTDEAQVGVDMRAIVEFFTR